MAQALMRAATALLALLMLGTVSGQAQGTAAGTELASTNDRRLNILGLLRCGNPGERCCKSLGLGKRRLQTLFKGPGVCNPGAFCDQGAGGFGLFGKRRLQTLFSKGVCVPCGLEGQTCCPGAAPAGPGFPFGGLISRSRPAVPGPGLAGCAPGLFCGADVICTSCGQVGQRCCPGSTGAPPCEANAFCAGDGFCRPCGVLGAPCCGPSNTCGGNLFCSGGICSDCGFLGAPCCSGSVCGSSLVCSAFDKCANSCGAQGQVCCAGRTCGSGLSCNKDTICEVNCGDLGEPCCRVGSGFASSQCSSDNLVCSSRSQKCVSCGDLGEFCCSGNVCDDGLKCGGKAGLQRTCSQIVVPPPECGGLRQPCCTDGGRLCSLGLRCFSGFCNKVIVKGFPVKHAPINVITVTKPVEDSYNATAYAG